MAVDKKSQHYTSTQNYQDLEGNSKSFTFVDHDVKTKIGAKVITEEEAQEAKHSLTEYKKKIIDDILASPASACPAIYHDFTIRGEPGISWNETMLRDDGVPLQRLRDILVLLQNALERGR